MSRTPKCTPLINGLEVCDRVKPRHASVNLSNMALSDVVSVNRYGGYFDKNFCVTVDNTDALGLFAHERLGIPIQDAIKSKRLPPTVVCVNQHKANMYLRAFGRKKSFGEFVEELGECRVSDIRHVVEDASSMKGQGMSDQKISQQLDLPDGIGPACHSLINQVLP